LGFFEKSVNRFHSTPLLVKGPRGLDWAVFSPKSGIGPVTLEIAAREKLGERINVLLRCHLALLPSLA